MKIKYHLTKVIDSDPFVAACTDAEATLAQQIAEDTRKYVPALTGTLDRNTRIVRNTITYYGRQLGYLWEGHVMVNAKTGKGPPVVPGVGPRWRRGTKLMPTSRPLNYTKIDMHEKAGDHWMDRSERDNGRKWAQVAERSVKNGYDHY